jgi:HPt (histidine-containing phosphotransfer) domain-containing protein
MLKDFDGEPLFDEDQIALLREAIGPEDLLSMLSELSPAAAKSCNAIAEALMADDIDQARKAAHILKGCVSTFGAWRLAMIAAEIELELTTIDAMRDYMPILIETLNQTEAALTQAAGGGVQ